MKLNKSQIEAIARKILNTIEEKRKQHNKALNEKKELFIEDVLKNDTVLVELAKYLKEGSKNYYFESVKTEYIKNKYKKEIKKLGFSDDKYINKYINSNDIINDITISTIDSSIDIDKLIEELTKKYE